MLQANHYPESPKIYGGWKFAICMTIPKLPRILGDVVARAGRAEMAQLFFEKRKHDSNAGRDLIISLPPFKFEKCIVGPRMRY